jgi:TonB family protein
MSGVLRPYAGVVFGAVFLFGTIRGATPDTSTHSDFVIVSSNALRQAATFHQEPEYPAAARQFRISGEVTVELTVDQEGKVENVTVVKGRPLLNEAVLRAVRKWSFSPYLVAGHPTKVKSTLSFNFSL